MSRRVHYVERKEGYGRTSRQVAIHGTRLIECIVAINVRGNIAIRLNLLMRFVIET